MRRPAIARHRLAALPLAGLLAVGAAVLPPAAAPITPFLAALDAPVARAADGVAITTETRYTVVPDEAVIRVVVTVRVRNEKPNSVQGGAITRYYYDAVNLGLQAEASRIRATQGGVALPVDVARRKDYKLVTVGLRESLFFREQATLRLTFELPGGKPRSESDVRVGQAFVTFLAWAFGDSGSVRIEVPRPFEVSASGEELERSTADGVTVLSASAPDALAWYAWINARNDFDLTRELVDIAGGDEIVVRGWPEDARWRQRVADVLERGVPELVERIGLPWPVDGPLTVVEVHTALLEGYAGFYDPTTDEITVSEDLDDLTIVHEASHAWFNRALFTERWISEGLADEYAARVLGALGEPAEAPGEVSRTAEEAFPLNGWGPPAAIRDEDSGKRERYGYDASWLVMRRIVEAVGDEGMRAAFAAADDGTTAYIGAGPAEPSGLANDWRRLLDLVEELGGADGIDDLLATWALTEAQAAGLDTRDQARDAYHELLDEGDGWAAPAAVRLPLDRWAFDDAEGAIAAATRILERRDETAAQAADAGLTPSDDLETAYEGARDLAALAHAAALADETLDALEAVEVAGDAAAAPRDWQVTLGLDGTDPDGDLAAARDAWEAGDPAIAAERAAAVSSTLAAAPERGRQKALLIGSIVGVVLVALVVLLLVARRRRRRRAAVPAGPDRYATLPASAAPGADAGAAPGAEPGAGPAGAVPSPEPGAGPAGPPVDEEGAEPS